MASKKSQAATSDKKGLPRGVTRRGEPQTMEELLSAYGGKFSGLSVGSKVNGVVTEKSSGRLVVDIGAKSEGLVAERAYKEAEDFIKTLSVGDEIEGTVLVSETPDGYTILSLRRSAENATWKKLEAAKNNFTPLEVEIIGTAQSGFTVIFNGLNGFIPASQLGRDISKNPQSLIGKKIHAAVIDFDRESNKIVLSEKEISEKDELEKVRDVMKNLKEGDVFDGVVTTIYDFGCFVKIEIPKGKEKIPVEGLVHVSELVWNKVGSPTEVVNEGEKVKVKLIGRRNGKLAFSIKQTQKDPWQEISEKYKKDDKAKGNVVKVSDFGVFVSLEPGVEGLVHITKIPPDKKLHVGDVVNVYVEDIDKVGKKLSLGLVLTQKPVGYK